MSFSIPTELYQLFRNMPRVDSPHDYSLYVTDPRDDSFLRTLVRRLERMGREAGFDEWERLNFVISFVQSLRYRYDNGYRALYPIETLVHRGGDCEDTSILTAALLRHMGYSVVLLFFEHWGEKAAHLVVCVAEKCQITQ